MASLVPLIVTSGRVVVEVLLGLALVLLLLFISIFVLLLAALSVGMAEVDGLLSGSGGFESSGFSVVGADAVVGGADCAVACTCKSDGGGWGSAMTGCDALYICFS